MGNSLKSLLTLTIVPSVIRLPSFSGVLVFSWSSVCPTTTVKSPARFHLSTSPCSAERLSFGTLWPLSCRTSSSVRHMVVTGAVSVIFLPSTFEILSNANASLQSCGTPPTPMHGRSSSSALSSSVLSGVCSSSSSADSPRSTVGSFPCLLVVSVHHDLFKSGGLSPALATIFPGSVGVTPAEHLLRVVFGCGWESWILFKALASVSFSCRP